MWKTKKLSANIKTLRKFVFTPHMLMRFWILSVEIKIVLTFLYVKMKSDMQGRIGTATFRLFLRKYKRQKSKFYLDLMMAHTTPQWILRCTFVLCVCVVILCWGKSFFKNSLRIWKRFCSHNVCQSRNCRIHITCNASPILLMVNGQNYVAWHQLPDIRFYMRNIFSACPYKTSWWFGFRLAVIIR